MYKYKITSKQIFAIPLTSSADSKEEIEAATGMVIDDLTWSIVEKGKKGMIEDADYVLIIEKIK
jgi:hypothetical protein